MFASSEIQNAIRYSSRACESEEGEPKERKTAPMWMRLPNVSTGSASHRTIVENSEDVVDFAGFVYLLAVVPPVEELSYFSIQGFAEMLIKVFSPQPVKIHVALLSFGSNWRADKPFSTYMGTPYGADWDDKWSKEDMVSYYLHGVYSGCWRAFPIMTSSAQAASLLKNCTSCTSAPYSVSRYACSVPPFRRLAAFLSDTPKSPAHCAGLVARVLSKTFGFLRHAPPYYSPATLYEETRRISLVKESVARLRNVDWNALASEEHRDEQRHGDVLSFGTFSEVESMSEEHAMDALSRASVELLNARMSDEDTDAKEASLATMLLRYSCSR